ncbi:MAG: DUF1080 domain-containing protein [Gemmataceae bacterium]|nr:DUF1080 domain-containing protein [Gemmataceae bacterium]
MKCMRGSHALLGAVVAGLVLASPGGAGDEFKVEPGYTSLFNGKDLTGWRSGKTPLDGKTETANKKWQVIDGAIVIHGGGGGDLYTVKNFDRDFHLKLEFRAAPRADSGLYLRGTQLQVRDYPTVGPYTKARFNKGGWNELDVTVKSGHISTTVNGKAVSPQDLLELTVKNGKPVAKLNGKPVEVSKIDVSVGTVAACRCNGEVIEKAYKVGARGGVGLQSESGKFEFRRIRIKELE